MESPLFVKSRLPGPPASNQVQFSINVSADFANVGYALSYYLGGFALENRIWGNLLNNVQQYCSSINSNVGKGG